MKFRCDACSAQYMISDEKVGTKGVRVRCKKCGEVITVRPIADPAVTTDPALAAGGEQPQREPTAVDEEPAAVAGGASSRSELDFGGDDELGTVLNDILGGVGGQSAPGSESEEEEQEEDEDEDVDRQSTRVFNVEEMQKVQAEREKATRETEERGQFSDLFQSSQAAAAQPAAAAAGLDRSRVEWYAAVEDRQVGPMSLADLSERFEKAEFDADTLVWKTGFEEWLPVHQVAELQFLAEEPPAPAPAPAADAEPEADWRPSAFTSDSRPGDDTQSEEEEEHETGASEDQDDGDWADEPDDSGEAAGEEGDGYYDEERGSSRAANAQAFGADVDWKPSALSSLSAVAEEELASLRPQDPEPEPDLPAEEDGASFGLGEAEEEAPMEDGDSSLIAQIAAEEEAAARRAEEERQEQERQAELARRKEEEAAQAAQEAARREKQEEQRVRVAPPVEQYMPPRGGLPKWAIGLMAGGGLLVVVLIGFLGFTVYKLSTSAVDSAQGGPQPMVPPAAGTAADKPTTPAGALSKPAEPTGPATSPETQPAVPGTGPGAAPDTKPADQPPAADAAAAGPATPAVARPEPAVREPKKPVRPVSPREPKPRVARKDPTPPPPPPPPPEEEEKPKPRPKSKGGILDFEDPDDRAFAGETGAEIAAKAPKAEKKELPELTNADVLAVMRSHLAEFKACNRKQKERDASVSGKMVISFSVNDDGRVGKASLTTTEFNGTFVGECIMGVIKRLKFPESGGGPKTVPFPFTVN